jgi:hypothetical protein
MIRLGDQFTSRLDDHAQRIIEQRQPAMTDFFSCVSIMLGEWHDAPLESDYRKALLKHVRALKPSEQAFFDLADRLELVVKARRTLMVAVWSRGWFDQFDRQRSLRRPEFIAVVPRLQTILNEHSTIKARVAALYESGLCRDLRIAQVVAEKLVELNVLKTAAGLARGVVLACIEYGEVGLLAESGYPWQECTLPLLRQAATVSSLVEQPDIALSVLHKDLLALNDALSSTHPPLWQQHLVTDPPGSIERQRYCKRLRLPQQAHVVVWLINRYRYTEVEASKLVETFLAGGLSELISWRCAVVTSDVQSLLASKQRTNLLNTLFSGLHRDARRELEQLLGWLQAAWAETEGLPSLMPLLTDQPSSRRRIRRGRRVQFGVPAIVLRRHRRRQQRKRHLLALPHALRLKQQADTLPTLSSEQRLVELFATKAGLEEPDARNRLRNLYTYGALGLLPREQWSRVIDQQQFSWLQLIRLGHLEGRVSWTQVLCVANRWGTAQGLPKLSAQLAQPIFNSIAQPRNWHGGQGSVVDAIGQRGNIATNRPLLHTTWIVIPLKLSAILSDYQNHSSVQCHMLLVVDTSSLLPVGGWVSTTEPNETEVCLAIYDAIWHPAVLGWPLRGIPEQIVVPEKLAINGLKNLQQASTFLLSTVTIASEKEWSKIERPEGVLLDLQMLGSNHVRQVRRDSGERMFCGQALRVLLQWLYPRCFPHHRVAQVPYALRHHGVAMPGYDTPAAGRLLPVIGTVETAQNAVILNGQKYSGPGFHSTPRVSLQYRQFPYNFPLAAYDVAEVDLAAKGIFVETHKDGVAQLHYLTSVL